MANQETPKSPRTPVVPSSPSPPSTPKSARRSSEDTGKAKLPKVRNEPQHSYSERGHHERNVSASISTFAHHNRTHSMRDSHRDVDSSRDSGIGGVNIPQTQSMSKHRGNSKSMSAQGEEGDWDPRDSKDKRDSIRHKRKERNKVAENTKALTRKLGKQLDILSSITEARTLQIQMKAEQELKEEKIDITQKVIHLPRGGFYVNTLLGPIQFGLPPETIKDSMLLGLTLPSIFVLPKERFNLKMGINVGEFEFPAYYTFFLKRKKITLVVEPDVEPLIRTIFTETLLGPQKVQPPARFTQDVPAEAYPDLEKEMSHFRVNPFDKKELTVDTILQFVYFKEGAAKFVTEEGKEVEIRDADTEYIISQEGKEHARVSCHVFISPPLNLVDGKEEKKEDEIFIPPYFGVTMLGNSDGFDKEGRTTGFVLWMNRRGIMVDPPPHSGTLLKKHGIHPRLIRGVILTHCHADHDAGTFQKILEEGRVVLLTTEVIGNSFLRKYSAISGLDIEFLKKLFIFRPVLVGEKNSVYGGFVKFFYSLHSIPCVGFVAYSNGKSMIYSGDSYNDPEGIQKIYEKGFMTAERRDKLINFPWHHDLILHEAGVPPIHTPLKTLESLPADVKARLYVVHKPSRDVPENVGLKSAKVGPSNTIVISNQRGPHFHAMEILDLLGSIDVFSSLVVSRSVELLGCARRRVYNKGDTLIKEGTEGDEMYIVAMGVVSVSVKDKIVKYLYVGDHFGEMALISGVARTATVVAQTEVEAITIARTDFMFVSRGTDAVERLKQLGVMQMSRSWQVMMKNSLLSEATSSQKTSLQSILRIKEYKSGEEVWTSESDATCAVLIDEGQFTFAGAGDAKPFTCGAFVGDMFALLNDEPLTTTLICTEKGTVYYVNKEDLLKFFDDNPGFRVFFLDRRFVE